MWHRRDALLRLGQIGLGALTLPQLLQAERTQAANRAAPRRTATAKSCILVYLWGGPPQQDLWDMKPLSPTPMRSLFQPIATAVTNIDLEHTQYLGNTLEEIAFEKAGIFKPGVPAIIAMQGQVFMDTVRKMMPVFFRELLKDGQLDRAMAVARRAAVVAKCSDAWMPALFLRLKSGGL